MKSALALLSVMIVCTMLFVGCSKTKSETKPSPQQSSVKTSESSLAAPAASPKINTCHKCLEWSGLECKEKNAKGECIRWGEHCKQWEDYPC